MKSIHQKLTRLIQERNIYLDLPEDTAVKKKVELTLIANSILTVSSNEFYGLTEEELEAIDWAQNYLFSLGDNA